MHEGQVAEHKAEMTEFDNCLGVRTALQELMIKADNDKWLEALHDEKLGFMKVKLLQILTHLHAGCS